MARPPKVMVKRIYEGNGGFRDEHPTFGIMSIHRISGDSGPIFGSVTPSVPGWIEIRFSEASREHKLGRDWIFAHRRVFSASMTYASFVNAMATVDSSGVPVNLETRQDGPDGHLHVYPEIEWPDDTDGTEAHATLERVREDTRKIVKEFASDRAEIEAILKDARLPKSARDKISAVLQRTERRVGNLPFYLDSVREAGEKVVDAVKNEVNGLVNDVTVRLGKKALRMLEGE